MELKALPLHHNTMWSTSSAPPPLPPAAHIHRHPFHLAFYWGKEAQFLFPGWPDNKSGMYGVSLVFVFALAIFAEFLSNLNLVKPGSNRVAAIFFQTGFHAVRTGFSYLVMLAVMSYNGGVFIAAVLGHAVGCSVIFMGLFTFSSFWSWYLMRLLPGWPDHQSLYDYCFSLFLVFLLTFTAEFCSNYPITRRSDPRLAALSSAALRALQMFMTYLAIIAIIATDFVFFAAAVGGHAVGNFVAGIYQYHIEEVESTLYDCSCGCHYSM